MEEQADVPQQEQVEQQGVASVDPSQTVEAQEATLPPPPPPQSKRLVYGMMAGGVLLVLLIGFVVFRLAFSHEPNATDITPTPYQKIAVEPVANWQTYTVGQMSVKHSKTWGPEKPKDGIFTTTRDSQAEKDSLNPGKGWLEIVRSDKSLEQLQPRGGIDVKKDIEINGQKGVRFEGSNTGVANSVYYVQVFFQRSEGLYKIHFFSQDKSLKDEFLNEFEQILSTVKFIEQ